MSPTRIGRGYSKSHIILRGAVNPTVYLGIDGSDLIHAPTNLSRWLFRLKFELFIIEMDDRINRTYSALHYSTPIPLLDLAMHRELLLH